jgi:hypothetical protein
MALLRPNGVKAYLRIIEQAYGLPPAIVWSQLSPDIRRRDVKIWNVDNLQTANSFTNASRNAVGRNNAQGWNRYETVHRLRLSIVIFKDDSLLGYSAV